MSENREMTMLPPPEGITVYIIDDDLDVRRSLRFLLEMDGFIVLTFASAESLLDFEGRGGSDCLIIDYKMQPMHGLELTRRLRKLGVNTPVILITGFPDDHIAARAAAIGIRKVMVKPHLDENITTNVREALELSQPGHL